MSDDDIRKRVESVYRLYACERPITEHSNEWPTPETIQNQLPAVQAFSEGLLPESLRPLVTDVTERMQVPMDYPAVVMVLCLAGVVNRRAMIQPKELDTGWIETANLWGSIVGPPGKVMKTPVIHAASVARLFRFKRRGSRNTKSSWQSTHALSRNRNLQSPHGESSSKRAKKSGSAAPERPPEGTR